MSITSDKRSAFVFFGLGFGENSEAGRNGLRRFGRCLILTFFVAALMLASLPAAASAAPAGDKPKVIVLGFDGVDSELTRQFMNEGHLPRLKELDGRGGFSPLGTTNPAQSPVAWGSIVTGLNPGKTNLAGFIRRELGSRPMPTIATVEDKYDGLLHSRPFSEFSALNRDSKWIILIGCSVVALILVFVLAKIILGAAKAGSGIKKIASLVAGAAAAIVVVIFGSGFFDGMPADVPFPFNLHQGEFFWNVLGENDVRCTGLFAPGAYPCITADNSRIIGGLGNPDVSGSTGTWYIYTDDDWVIQDQGTRTGGMVVRLEQKGGRIFGTLYGPSNFVEEDRFEQVTKDLTHRIRELRDSGGSGNDVRRRIADLELELDANKDSLYDWKGQSDKKTKSIVEFTVKPDRAAGKVTIELAGATQTLGVGDWSEWFNVDFEMSPFVKVPAIARMRLTRCDEEMIRIFVPAIDISPRDTPGYLRISSPDNFADQLVGEVGLFETVGWSCITHGLKDEEIDERTFLEDIEYTMNLREKLFKNRLDAGDFDTLLAVFYTPDRVQHMMYRLFDSGHPLFDGELAEETITFFGNEINLKDAMLESYKQVDRIVGETCDRIASGEFGEDAVLLVVSDHGFAPYYYGVNLNNFLVEKGYMHLQQGGESVTLEEVRDLSRGDFLMLVDWNKTRAYSLGLGKIFINLEGREPDGIVAPEEYDAVRDAIIADLESYVDEQNGRKIVKEAYKREEVFSGPFWREGSAEFVFNRTEKAERKTDGFADILLGFNRGYRVSWQTTMGGLEESTIVQNDLKWSGDHVSVAPDSVKGIFFTNRKIAESARAISVVDIVPTVYDLYGIEIPADIDGSPIPLADARHQ